MTYPAPVGYHTPLSRTPYFFNTSRDLIARTKKEFINSSLFGKIAFVVVIPFFLIATAFFDLPCMGANLVYRWKLTPTLRENTKAITGPITELPAQLVLQYLDSSDLDKFLLDPQTLGIAELKGHIEQTGVITAQQVERLEFLNAHCGPNQKIGIDPQKVFRISLEWSDITDEQLCALLKSFPHVDEFGVEPGCRKLTQKGVQTIIEQTSRQWKHLWLHNSFRSEEGYKLEYGDVVNIAPALLDALRLHGSSLETLSIKYWFPPQDAFDQLLQNCPQLKSFSAVGIIDSDAPNSPSIAKLASCLSLEKLHIRRFGNQQDALPRIFENCPLQRLSFFDTPLNGGSLQVLAQSRQNDLRTLRIFERGLTQNDIQALGRHCHGLQLLSIPYNAQIPNSVYEELLASNQHLEAFAFCANYTPMNDPTLPDFAGLARARPNLKYFYSAVRSVTAVEDMRTMIQLCPELKSIWISISDEGDKDDFYEATRECKQQLKSEFPHISFERFQVVDWKPWIRSNG